MKKGQGLRMSREEVLKLAHKYADMIPVVQEKGQGGAFLRHLKSMPAKMDDMEDTEKMMRWLGFMQGVLWAEGWFLLDELQHHNKYGLKI